MGTTTITTALHEDAVSRMRRLQSGRRTHSGEVMAGISSAYFGTAREMTARGIEPAMGKPTIPATFYRRADIPSDF